jgi:hypothetical protein
VHCGTSVLRTAARAPAQSKAALRLPGAAGRCLMAHPPPGNTRRRCPVRSELARGYGAKSA